MATSTGVRYSDGKEDTDGRSKFAWEYPVPTNAFWNDLPFTLSRNFLSNYAEEEIRDLPIDGDSKLPKNKRLELLDDLLKERLTAKNNAAAPKTFYDVDYPGWDRLWLGISSIQQELGLPEAEQTLRMMCERRKDKSNLSHFHNLAGLLLAKGEYHEAETTETEVKVWLESKLGKDSPQALGAGRILVEAVWKQGVERRMDAERLLGEMREVVEGMGDGSFGMYQEDERGFLQKLEERLRSEDTTES
jgi:hypothetical protein